MRLRQALRLFEQRDGGVSRDDLSIITAADVRSSRLFDADESPARADRRTPRRCPDARAERDRRLTQYLIEQRRHHPEATGDFNELVLGVAQACKQIARTVAHGSLARRARRRRARTCRARSRRSSTSSPTRSSFARPSGTASVRHGLRGDGAATRRSRASTRAASYLLVFDPLDGSSNIDVNVAVGTHLLDPRAHPSASPSPRSPTSCSPARAGRGGLRDLRTLDDARPHRRPRRRRLHPRPDLASSSSPTPTSASPRPRASSRSTRRTAASGSLR